MPLAVFFTQTSQLCAVRGADITDRGIRGADGLRKRMGRPTHFTAGWISGTNSLEVMAVCRARHRR